MTSLLHLHDHFGAWQHFAAGATSGTEVARMVVETVSSVAIAVGFVACANSRAAFSG